MRVQDSLLVYWIDRNLANVWIDLFGDFTTQCCQHICKRIQTLHRQMKNSTFFLYVLDGFFSILSRGIGQFFYAIPTWQKHQQNISLS